MLSCPKYKLGKSFNLKKNKINKSKLWSEIICNNQESNVNYSTVNQAVILFSWFPNLLLTQSSLVFG